MHQSLEMRLVVAVEARLGARWCGTAALCLCRCSTCHSGCGRHGQPGRGPRQSSATRTSKSAVQSVPSSSRFSYKLHGMLQQPNKRHSWMSSHCTLLVPACDEASVQQQVRYIAVSLQDLLHLNQATQIGQHHRLQKVEQPAGLKSFRSMTHTALVVTTGRRSSNLRHKSGCKVSK